MSSNINININNEWEDPFPDEEPKTGIYEPCDLGEEFFEEELSEEEVKASNDWY